MPKGDDLIIDPEFEGLLDPLTEEEEKALEKKIIAEGMTEKVKTWAGHGIVVDGHNRLKIVRRHSLPFDVEPLKFDSREDVVEWILANQLGRRNLNPARRRYFLGMLYEREKGKAGVAAGGAADEKVAKKVNAAPRTVRRAAKFKERVDKLDADAKKAVLGGKAKLKPEATRPAPGKKKKQGKVKFDFAEFNRCLGVVTRGPDTLREKYGDSGVNNEKWGSLNRMMREWQKAWEAVKAQVLKEAGKAEKLEKVAAK